MKKLVRIILSVVLVFTLGVSMTACDEVEEKEYYKITYSVNGTQYGDVQSVEKGQTAILYAIPDITPEVGYHYCWQVEGGKYLPDTTFTPTSDTNIVLVLVNNPPEPMTHYSIIYLASGKQFGEIQKVAIGRGIIVYDYPTTSPKTGYHYAWSYNGTVYEAGSTFTPTCNMALELIEVENPKAYSVTYKINGKTFGQAQSVGGGQSVTLYDIPELYIRDGYSYFWKVEGGERITKKTYVPTDDTVLYLEEVANVGTVNFKICNEKGMGSIVSGTMQSITLKTGDSIPTATFNCLDTHEFSGWSLVDSYGSIFSPTETIDVILIPENGATVTVYAQYNQVLF